VDGESFYEFLFNHLFNSDYVQELFILIYQELFKILVNKFITLHLQADHYDMLKVLS